MAKSVSFVYVTHAVHFLTFHSLINKIR